MNAKQEAAVKAISLLKKGDVVGLRAGSTIKYLVEFLGDQIAALDLKFVTSSFSTRQLLLQQNIPFFPVSSFREIDIYFDGCDQFDGELNALKSGGGIHTMEKLLALMAKQFVLVGDESKVVETFDKKYPLVVEVLPQAELFAPFQLKNLFENLEISMRMDNKKDGPVMTENGNLLLDIYFEKWPPISNINDLVKTIVGVVETSLFYGIAQKAVVGGNGGVRIIEKRR